ncbi:hypothetical protein CFIO01_09618 [Colletotrichum fioriniae PJ7]|uniref:Uncharacterized protein n=1 Tax=Colletotrichum fioriniae PJ7 TaxID=1445577 RepID=A0A010QXV8_9PEZI|nr:hypothetical protein CFIO01_09618 [Colletotrichum fioriniae PJ7]
MSVVKSVTSGIMAWVRTPRTPTYRKLTAEIDTEALRSPSSYDKQSFSHRLQRTSPKALVKLVVPVLLFSGLLLAVNHAADERIRKDWSIIISTQKKCWPDASLGSDPHCDNLPESSAREDMYGPHTDEDPKQMHDLRPRYVNSGSLMGPVGDMKRMFRRAQEKVDEKQAAGAGIFSDQGIFAEIFGEQEIWRTSKRQNHDEWVKLQIDHPEKASKELEQNDFSVGLDYIQDLFTPTVFEEDDGLYIVSSDGPGLRQAAADRGIDPPRVVGIPEDMLGLRSPIQETAIDKTMGWKDLPLYTDFWSTSVPVVVHHNAHRNGLKGQRLRDWWKNNWFFPYLRSLLELQSRPREALKPLFRAPGRNGVEDLVYVAPASDAQKRKPRIFKKQDLKKQGLAEADWDTLCKSEGHDEWWNELLQDGDGPL